MKRRTAADLEELEKARRYVSTCDDRVTGAMHCSDEEFTAASKELRRAQLRLARLERED